MSFYIDRADRAAAMLTSFPFPWELTAFIVYVVGCIVLYLACAWVFGFDTADRIMIVPGIGLVLIFRVGDIAYKIVTWPFRFRDERIFRDEFDLDREDMRNRSMIQYKVDRKLTELADIMKPLFDEQRYLRYTKGERRLPDAEKHRLAEIDGYIESYKEEFWRLHGTAKKRKLVVRKHITDYATPPQPEPAPVTVIVDRPTDDYLFGSPRRIASARPVRSLPPRRDDIV